MTCTSLAACVGICETSLSTSCDQLPIAIPDIVGFSVCIKRGLVAIRILGSTLIKQFQHGLRSISKFFYRNCFS